MASLKDKYCIVGVGNTGYGKLPGRSARPGGVKTGPSTRTGSGFHSFHAAARAEQRFSKRRSKTLAMALSFRVWNG